MASVSQDGGETGGLANTYFGSKRFERAGFTGTSPSTRQEGDSRVLQAFPRVRVPLHIVHV